MSGAPFPVSVILNPHKGLGQYWTGSTSSKKHSAYAVRRYQALTRNHNLQGIGSSRKDCLALLRIGII